jgi:hypothetical protein
MEKTMFSTLSKYSKCIHLEIEKSNKVNNRMAELSLDNERINTIFFMFYYGDNMYLIDNLRKF